MCFLCIFYNHIKKPIINIQKTGKKFYLYLNLDETYFKRINNKTLRQKI